MRLVVTKNPYLIIVMIAAMLFPMFLAEGAAAFEAQTQHPHPAGDTSHYHAPVELSGNVEVVLGIEVSAISDGVVGDVTKDDCHHVPPQGGCSLHCSNSSCVTILMDFGANLVSVPKTALHSISTLRIPDPLPTAIHRPPLADV